jgi:hypothetical protein
MMKTFLTGLRESLFPMNLEHSHDCLLYIEESAVYVLSCAPTYLHAYHEHLPKHTYTYIHACRRTYRYMHAACIRIHNNMVPDIFDVYTYTWTYILCCT